MALTKVIGDGLGTLTGNADFNGDLDVDGTTNLDSVDIDGNLDVTGASNSVVTLIKPQGALPDNNDNAGLYVLHQGTAGTGLRVRTDNALTGSNFAHILVNNASASINAFQVSQYGSGLIAKFDKSGTTAMQIDNSSAVTKPLQPSFLVNPSSNQENLAIGTSTNVTIVYGNERYDVGSNFASNTFTAPVTGRYMLFSQIFLLNVDKAQTYIQHFLKTSNLTYSNVVSNNQMFAADIDYMTLNQSVVTDMDASDTAFVQINMSGGTQQMDIRTDSFFGGMLIG